MLLDDTKDKVYIHNLDDELSDADSDAGSSSGERLVFLPDIERKLGKIPKVVLTDGSGSSDNDKQMVLYRVPESLTVPREQDNVRKAIIETRERMRQKQMMEMMLQASAPAAAADNGSQVAGITASTRNTLNGGSGLHIPLSSAWHPAPMTDAMISSSSVYDEDAMDIG